MPYIQDIISGILFSFFNAKTCTLLRRRARNGQSIRVHERQNLVHQYRQFADNHHNQKIRNTQKKGTVVFIIKCKISSLIHYLWTTFDNNPLYTQDTLRQSKPQRFINWQEFVFQNPPSSQKTNNVQARNGIFEYDTMI